MSTRVPTYEETTARMNTENTASTRAESSWWSRWMAPSLAILVLSIAYFIIRAAAFSYGVPS